MTQAEFADELAKEHARLVDLIERFYQEKVEDRYEILLGSIADRFSNAGFPQYEKTFRPATGIAITYGTWDPGLELARMEGRASKLEAIIEELRRNPTARLKTKPRVVSHDPEGVAADLKPILVELRELLDEASGDPLEQYELDRAANKQGHDPDGPEDCLERCGSLKPPRLPYP